MNQDQMGQVPSSMEPKQAVNPALLWIFIVVVLGGGGYFAWYFLGNKTTKVETPTVTPTVTATRSATRPSTSVLVSPTTSSSVSEPVMIEDIMP